MGGGVTNVGSRWWLWAAFASERRFIQGFFSPIKNKHKNTKTNKIQKYKITFASKTFQPQFVLPKYVFLKKKSSLKITLKDNFNQSFFLPLKRKEYKKNSKMQKYICVRKSRLFPLLFHKYCEKTMGVQESMQIAELKL